MKISILLLGAVFALAVFSDAAIYKRRPKLSKSLARSTLLQSPPSAPSSATSAASRWTAAAIRWPRQRPARPPKTISHSPDDSSAGDGTSNYRTRWKLVSVVPSLPRSKKYWLNKAVIQVDGNDDKLKGKRGPQPSTSRGHGSDSDNNRPPKKHRSRSPSPESSDWEEKPFRSQVTRRVLKKKVDKAAPATQEDSSSDSEPHHNVARKIHKKQKSAATSDDLEIVFESAISPTARQIEREDRAGEPVVYLKSHKQADEPPVKLQPLLLGTDFAGNTIPMPFYQRWYQLRPGAHLRVGEYRFFGGDRAYAVNHADDPLPPKGTVDRKNNPIAKISKLKPGESYRDGGLVFFGKDQSFTFRADSGMMGYSYDD